MGRGAEKAGAYLKKDISRRKHRLSYQKDACHAHASVRCLLENYGLPFADWQTEDERGYNLPQDHSSRNGKRMAEIFSTAFC